MSLQYWQHGSGPPVLCLHETAANGQIWRPLAIALGDRVRTIAPDRRGWGGSEAPQSYTRTTVAEQSEDAWRLLEELDAAPAVLCGAGLGAVAALDLLMRRPESGCGAVLVEPPLFAFVPEATEALSADGDVLRHAFQQGGTAGALAAYLRGAMPGLGPGAERMPAEIAGAAESHSMTLFVELAAVPAWEPPYKRLAACSEPIRVVVNSATPPLVRTACEALVGRLGNGALLEQQGSGLPHYDGASELAESVFELV